jgi:hypothetical protein
VSYKARYKVGDWVMVRRDLTRGQYKSHPEGAALTFTTDMLPDRGLVTQIAGFSDFAMPHPKANFDRYLLVGNHNSNRVFNDAMLEPAEDPNIRTQGRRSILL